MNGDEIEILTDDKSFPPMAWEKIAVSGKAKLAIRRINKEKIKSQYSELGKEIVDRLVASYTTSKKLKDMDEFCKKFGLKSKEDFYSKVGRGEITNDMVIKAFAKLKIIDTNQNENTLTNISKDNEVSIPVRGFDRNIPVKFAENSKVVPGDKIFGILDTNSGITIYSKLSKNLSKHGQDQENFIDLTWDIDKSLNERFIARIMIECKNQVGALAKISRAIGLSNANIENLSLVTRSSDFYKLDIDIGVFNLSHLNLIISSLRKLPVVHRVVRIVD